MRKEQKELIVSQLEVLQNFAEEIKKILIAKGALPSTQNAESVDISELEVQGAINAAVAEMERIKKETKDE